MRHHGDSLLRTITFGVLSELFGRENASTVLKTISWAVSNAFYEQLVLHYGLEKLCSQIPVASNGLTRMRGDILEVYMAAIDMDVSRDKGGGYQEIHDWLLKVMAIRLGMVSQCHLQGSRPASGGVYMGEPHKLHEFRRLIFENIKSIMQQSRWTNEAPRVSQLITFWSNVRTYLNMERATILPTEVGKALLIHYYRVRTNLLPESLTIQSYVNLRLDDRESASNDLCLVLRCNSCIYDSRVHKSALQRLISIQNEFSLPRVYWSDGEVCLRDIWLKLL